LPNFRFLLFLGILVKKFWSLDINIQLKRVVTSFPHHLSEWANIWSPIVAFL